MGAQGGHPDTAAGAKCTIVITPLLQGRIPAVRNQVTTVTTPGETVDVIVTDYGIAINPKRTDLLEAVKDSHISLKTIEELRDMAIYSRSNKEYMVAYLALKKLINDNSEFLELIKEIETAKTKQKLEIERFISTLNVEKNKLL